MGVHLIADGQITGGALIAAVMFGGRAMAPLGSIVNLASRYQSAKAALMSLDDLMRMPTERELGKRYLARPSLLGQIALHEVRFAYPQGSRAHSPIVLKGINLNIQPGERVALLGKIGSGKSTILRLMGALSADGGLCRSRRPRPASDRAGRFPGQCRLCASGAAPVQRHVAGQRLPRSLNR